MLFPYFILLMYFVLYYIHSIFETIFQDQQIYYTMKELGNISFEEEKPDFSVIETPALNGINSIPGCTNDCFFQCLSLIANDLDKPCDASTYQEDYARTYGNTEATSGILPSHAIAYFNKYFSHYGCSAGYSNTTEINQALDAEAKVIGLVQTRPGVYHAVVMGSYDPTTGKYSCYDPQEGMTRKIKASDIPYAIGAIAAYNPPIP